MALLRYRCLVLDHDDTVMDSTARIHYPAFLRAMDALRPGHYVNLEDYFRLNFSPGFLEYCEQTLHMTDEEMDREYAIWLDYVKDHIPPVYPGMARIIRRQKELGGYVCVSSHSVSTNIRRDYAANDLPEPDLVYGWDLPREQRKPDPWSLRQIMSTLSLEPADLLMVDDLLPGLEMARAAGVDFAAACWAYDVPEIRQYLQQNAPRCFDTPEALEEWLFD